MDGTPTHLSRQGPTILETALAHQGRGWSLIPIKPGTKEPACTWKEFQRVRPTETQLHKWFGDHSSYGLAVILGAVSGGLVCRDFDTMESYNTWALAHPDLAAILPTIATVRGRHVYFIADDLQFRDLGDGEYRGDSHYCLLPPSRHPEGTDYAWLTPLPDGPVPRVDDVVAAGLLATSAPVTEGNRGNRGLLR
jgi:hypothetical protein